MASVIKTLTKHSVIYGAGDMLAKSVGFLMIPVYTHYLSAEEYGILELLDLTSYVVGMLLAMGIAQSVVRYYFEYPDDQHRQQVVSVGLLSLWSISAVALPLLYLASPSLSRLIFDMSDHGGLFSIVFATLLVQLCNEIPMTMLRIQQRSVFYVSVALTRLVLNLSLNILFIVYYGMGVRGIVLAGLIASLAVGTFLVFHILSKITLTFSWSLAKSMLHYSFPLVFSWLGAYVLNFSDRFFLQRLASLGDVGIYSLAYKFGMIPNMIVLGPFSQIWGPKRFELVSRPDAQSIFARVFTYFWFLQMFFGLMVACLIKEIITVMAGAEFQSAYLYVPLVLTAYVAYGIYSYTQFGLLLNKKTMRLGYCVLSAAAVNVVANILLIPRLGIWGAAITTCGSFLYLAFIVHVVSQREFRILYDVRRFLHLTALAVGIYALTWLINVELLWLSVTLKGVCVLAYPVLLFATGFLTVDEREALRGLLARFRRREAPPVSGENGT